MRVCLDTSVIIDHLRSFPPAVVLIEDLIRRDAELHSSTVVRTEVLAGMRPSEEHKTRLFLDLVEWHAVDVPASEGAGALGREHLPANNGIDTPDLLLAELTRRLGAEMLTTNAKHFREMVPGLRAPYAY